MDSGGLCEAAGSPPISSLGANAALSYGGPGVAKTEWHSIPLEDASREKVDCAFHLIQGNGTTQQEQQQARKLEFSMCGLSTGALPEYTSTGSKKGLTVINVESADTTTGGKEVRLSFGDGFAEPLRNNSNNKKNNANNKSRNEAGGGALLAYGDEGCLPLLSQLRAFVKGAKLSCSALSSDGWGSILQRSLSFSRTTDSSSSPPENEMFCKKSSSTLSRTVSAPLACTGSGIGSPDALMKTTAGPLQARDPQSRAEALPLAHYRPTETGALSPPPGAAGNGGTPCKSPVNMNCKKPPRHPGRTASLDTATAAAQRAAARKSRDKASARRKSRTASAAANTSVTPLVALVLTIGFGVLMLFQGVFVQTNASYGRDADRAFVDVAGNLRSSLASQQATSDGYPYQRIDPRAASSSSLTSIALDSSIKSEAALGDALQKSMEELPWSRSSLQHQIKSSSG